MLEGLQGRLQSLDGAGVALDDVRVALNGVVNVAAARGSGLDGMGGNHGSGGGEGLVRGGGGGERGNCCACCACCESCTCCCCCGSCCGLVVIRRIASAASCWYLPGSKRGVLNGTSLRRLSYPFLLVDFIELDGHSCKETISIGTEDLGAKIC